MEKRAPITVKFEIPYFTVSGIQVRYLKIVEKSGYQALPWVRYITQNGDDYRSVQFHSSFDSVLMTLDVAQFADSTREGQCPDCTDVVLVLSVDFCYGGCAALLVLVLTLITFRACVHRIRLLQDDDGEDFVQYLL